MDEICICLNERKADQSLQFNSKFQKKYVLDAERSRLHRDHFDIHLSSKFSLKVDDDE